MTPQERAIVEAIRLAIVEGSNEELEKRRVAERRITELEAERKEAREALVISAKETLVLVDQLAELRVALKLATDALEGAKQDLSTLVLVHPEDVSQRFSPEYQKEEIIALLNNALSNDALHREVERQAELERDRARLDQVEEQGDIIVLRVDPDLVGSLTVVANKFDGVSLRAAIDKALADLEKFDKERT